MKFVMSGNIYHYPLIDRGGRNSLVFLISLFLALGYCSFAVLASAKLPEDKGEAIFEAKCAACHTIGGGDTVGPDLKGVTKNRDREWLVRFIQSPGKMFDKGDPTATGLLEKFRGIRMPDSGLKEEEIAALLSYLDNDTFVQPEKATGPSSVRPESRAEGDPLTGMSLFTGSIPFEKGGAPCIACHSIAGISSLGGGTLGPDLTETFEDYGGEELISVLSSVPFPAMNPVYDDHPISPREQEHLVAFMKGAVDKRMSSFAGQMSMLIGGIFLAILALTWLLWRNRLRDVRKTLVEESRKRRAK